MGKSPIVIRKTLIFAFFVVLSIVCPISAHSEEVPSDVVGSVFERPVTQSEFDFVYKTETIFSLSGKAPLSDEERRKETWKNIVLLREAENRHIEASPEEVRAELERLLVEKKVSYGSLVYHEWVEQSFEEDSLVFERRVRDLLSIKKVVQALLETSPVVIPDSELRQKFLNQYSSMATEFVQFPTLEEAQALYRKTGPRAWDEGKAKDPKFATPTGHISLEAVIDLWQVPLKDAYRIHSMKPGSIAAPAKMHKGYGVFRLLEKKNAELSQYTENKKKEYRDLLTQVYTYNRRQKAMQDVFDKAKIEDHKTDKVLVFQTSAGNFEVKLFSSVAPKACENMLKLAEKGYYDGTMFHRVIEGFMVQGGDPQGTGYGGESVWGKSFEDEFSDKVRFDRKGLLAMANSGPNSNGSQFFITLAATQHLHKKHTIFGEVVSGMDVVEKIGTTRTDGSDKPVTPQKIVKLSLKK